MLKETKNILLIQEVASGFGELLENIAFIGGTVAQVYVNDPGATDIRPTLDVDCVVSTSTINTYYNLEKKLRSMGFKNDTTSGSPICRWIYNGIIVDIMPTDEEILGFGNKWYVNGFKNKVSLLLPNGATIFVFPIEYYLATKIDAVKNRGGNDLRLSHDFEDIIYLFDNNIDIIQNINKSNDEELKIFLKNYLKELLDDINIEEAIKCALPINSEDDRVKYIIDLFNTLIKNQ